MTHRQVTIGPDSVVVRDDAVPTTPVDGDLVVLNMATNNYVGLDDIGRHIWTMIEHPRRVEDLCHALAAQYCGAPEAITSDVIAFLEELVGEKLVRVVNG
jgi:hypothetical protein